MPRWTTVSRLHGVNQRMTSIAPAEGLDQFWIRDHRYENGCLGDGIGDRTRSETECAWHRRAYLG